MLLNTQIRGAQIEDASISGSHLLSINSPSDDYVLSWDSDEDKFKWYPKATVVANEIPTGAINGTNKTFTISQSPLEDTEEVYLNGLLQEPGTGNDYTISDDTITFVDAPETGDVVTVSYLIHQGFNPAYNSGSSGATNVPYGYNIGGYDASYSSIIDRITFPFDSGTATHVGNLSDARYYVAGCNSSDYGYSMGGNRASRLSTIDRIIFPFDSGTATHVGNLSGVTYNSAGCNSGNYGYCMGGYSINHLSTIDRITFPFDSGTASHVGNLSGARYDVAGCNSSDYGYCMGGYSNQLISIIDRIIFPFDSGTASHVGNLSGARHYVAGCDGTDFVNLFV